MHAGVVAGSFESVSNLGGIAALVGWTAVAIFVLSRVVPKHSHRGRDADRNRRLLELAASQSHDAIVIIDLEGTIIFATDAVGRTLGYADNRVGALALELVHPDERHEAMANLAQLAGGRQDLRTRRRMLRADGGFLTCEIATSRLPADHGVEGFVLTVTDVTERMESEAALLEQQQINRAIRDLAACIIVTMAPDGRIVTFNRAAEELTGFDAADVVGRHYEILVPPEERQELAGVVTGLMDGSLPVSHENHWMTRDGERRLIRWTNAALVGDAGEVTLIVGTGTDVTDERRTNERLTWEARHDGLTGLPNRLAMVDHLETSIEAATDTGAPVSLLFVDLDGFKLVNDRLGHAAGDAVLEVVAERLRSAVRPDDLVARIGGDEFVLVCPGMGPADAAAAISRIQGLVSAPVDTAFGTVAVGASIGLTMGPDGRTADELLALADAAMYEAKSAQRAAAAAGHAHVAAPLHPDEERRLAAVAALDHVGQAGLRDDYLQHLASAAAAVCDAPGAVVSLVEEQRQRFLAAVGIDADETSRDEAFCAHTILGDDQLIVEDALADDRFRSNPAVLADPGVRFYAGTPVTSEEGLPLGALCVIDHRPRHLSPAQLRALEGLSARAEAHLRNLSRSVQPTE